MEQTRKSSYEIMMDHVAVGEIAACVPVIDPSDGEQAIFVSAFQFPGNLHGGVDGIALAILAIQHAHARAHAQGMEPLY